MRVIYLTESPLNKRDFDRFGVGVLAQSGYEVEVWDCTPFLNPKVFQTFKPVDSFQFKGHRVFHQAQDVCELLGIINELTILIVFIGYEEQHRKIYESISGNKFLHYGIESVNVVVENTKLSYSHRVSRLLRSPKRVIRFLTRRQVASFTDVRSPNFLLVGGQHSVSRFKVNPSTNLVWTHAWDYDIYLAEMNSGSKSLEEEIGPYAVFIDQYFPFHPDVVREGYKPIAAKPYYDRLVNFFERVEKKFGVKVVIAAHPRSRYQDHPDYFKGRKIVIGQTANLVHHSKLMLVHYSTAVNFGVLFHKPMIVMDSSREPVFKDGNYVSETARMLGRGVLDLDAPADSISWESEVKINEEAYAQFLENFIKTGPSVKKNAWLIFADYLKSLKKEKIPPRLEANP